MTRSQTGARTRAEVGAVYDRVGAQAWALAVWIVHDEDLAADIVVAAFACLPRDHGDASLLYDIRRRAIVAVAAVASDSPRAAIAVATVPAAILALPEPQRAVVELMLLGRLNVAAISAATTTPRTDVIARLADALRALQPMLRRELRGMATRCTPVADASQPSGSLSVQD